MTANDKEQKIAKAFECLKEVSEVFHGVMQEGETFEDYFSRVTAEKAHHDLRYRVRLAKHEAQVYVSALEVVHAMIQDNLSIRRSDFVKGSPDWQSINIVIGKMEDEGGKYNDEDGIDIGYVKGRLEQCDALLAKLDKAEKALTAAKL